MSATAVRRLVVAVCVLGIAGMIVSSIADNTGAALTCGLVTAVAVLCAIVATAVGGRPDEEQAARVEAAVQELVAAGAEEAAVRRLVGEAVRLGKGR
ncbi:MAG TPA: hypothetical protein VM938_09305 [Acidimicrobiales bacterium]|nr:hypothetical protein [Acidimicrobiales bacterium]